MAMHTVGAYALLAAWRPGSPEAVGAALAGLVLWLLWRWFLGSEKAQGCAEPVLWIIAGAGVVGVLALGAQMVLNAYSRADPMASQYMTVLLVAVALVAGVGGLLWVARTREGGRIITLIWLTARVALIGLGVGLLILGILFGTHGGH